HTRSLVTLTHTPRPAPPTLSLHDALPICTLLPLYPKFAEVNRWRWSSAIVVLRLSRKRTRLPDFWRPPASGPTAWSSTCDARPTDRKSTRLNSSHQIISYAVFCLKKKKHD